MTGRLQRAPARTGNDDPICRRFTSIEQATRLRRAMTLPFILPPRAAIVINQGVSTVNPNAMKLSVLVTILALFPTASFADARSGGEGTNTNVTLDNVCDEGTDIWEILESEALTTNSSSNCTVTACSDIANSSVNTTDNDYIFNISLNDTSPGLNQSPERSLEMSDNANVNDPDVVAVCSTRLIAALPVGTHTIYWLGCRATASDVSTTVNDTTMSITCSNGNEL